MRSAVAVAVLTMLLAPAASAQTADPRPPDAHLASPSQEVKAEIQAYCWTETDADGSGRGVCADRFDPIDPVQALVVDQGQLLTLRFDTPNRPDSISVSRRQTSTSAPIETFDVVPDNPSRFRADFPPGTHILTIFTKWPQGDATYVFEITVRTAQTGPSGTPPEILDAIALLTEAARGLAASDDLFEQRVQSFLASVAALVAAVQNLVNQPFGPDAFFGLPLPSPPQPT